MRLMMYRFGMLGIFVGLVWSVTSLNVWQQAPVAYAVDRLPCSNPAFTINERMPNGSRWSMCWEERSREGVILRAVQYAPPGGESIFILSQANMAQIFVPYDSGSPRIHDLTDFGLGDFNLNNLSVNDCPGGVLLQNNNRNILCKTVLQSGYGYKYYEQQKQAAVLRLFSVSQLGAYNYVVQWSFYDDGTIEPAVGATGQLQFCTDNPTYGWLIEGRERCQPSSGRPYGTSHIHTYYWRLDFDIQNITNNVVEQLEFAGSSTVSRELVRTPVEVETAVQTDPLRFRSWRVGNPNALNAEGHMRSYELLPNTDHTFRGPTNEPWTANDVYVTQHRACEMWVSHNPTTNGCGSHVADFVNGESLVDPIMWYGLTFHHLPHDEDDPYMSTHWSSFLLQPRDLFAVQPR